MSYYAKYSGYIAIKKLSVEDTKLFLSVFDLPKDGSVSDISNDNTFSQISVWPVGDNRYNADWLIDVAGYGLYIENSVYDFLNKISKFTESGEIYYSGEDESYWRFMFRNGSWHEDSGNITYQDTEDSIPK